MVYQFTLEKYNGRKSRYTCPQCNEVKEFARYIDVLTGNYIAEDVGRCNRVTNCGYHYTPKQFFTDNPNFTAVEHYPMTYIREQKKATRFDLISEDNFKQTLCDYDQNNFIKFLQTRFGIIETQNLICQYFIGTWLDGRTVFWQIDTRRLIRTGKIIAYNAVTGKRIKSQKPSWIHSELKKEKWKHLVDTEKRSTEFHLKQCFFGEHLLQLETEKPVGIVESEKTAVVASIFMPELLWVATGGCGNLNLDHLERAMRGRRVILFPDSSKFEYWSAKANEAKRLFNSDVQVSDLLEIRLTAEEKQEDYDIADFLLADKN